MMLFEHAGGTSPAMSRQDGEVLGAALAGFHLLSELQSNHRFSDAIPHASTLAEHGLLVKNAFARAMHRLQFEVFDCCVIHGDWPPNVNLTRRRGVYFDVDNVVVGAWEYDVAQMNWYLSLPPYRWMDGDDSNEEILESFYREYERQTRRVVRADVVAALTVLFGAWDVSHSEQLAQIYGTESVTPIVQQKQQVLTRWLDSI